MPKSKPRALLLCLAISFSILLPPGTANAQQVRWVTQFGGTGQDLAEAVGTDSTGVYVVGSTTPVAPPGVTPGSDGFIRKLSLGGATLWERTIITCSGCNDDVSSISVKSSGVYVAGTTSGTLSGQSSNGGPDAFIRKYDIDGNEVWTRQFGSATASQSDFLYAIAVQGSRVYVAGSTSGTFPGQIASGGSRDAFVARFDTSGVRSWVRQFTTGTLAGTYADATGLAVNSTGIYVSGASGDEDAFVRKYSANGTARWTRLYGTPGIDDWMGDVALDSSGVYLAGTAWSITVPNGPEAFAVKYDVNGNLLWSDQFGTANFDYGNGIAVNSTGVYVVGVWNATGGYPPQGTGDSYVRKYAPDGTILSTMQFGTALDDFTTAVSLRGSGAFVVGYTDGAFPGQVNQGSEDAFVARIA